MTTTELLIFDCDGVLIDSEPASSRVFCRALQNAGVEITPNEVHRRFTGYSETDAMRICREEFGLGDVAAAFAETRSNLYE
ncbi:MAG: HAD family phosphatase, partial [Clostridia bacterium]|nr:HAD family phosphatase [Clostridia bacterium]